VAQDIQVQVLSVGGRQTKTGKTVFEVALSDGQKYTTFNDALAQQANTLVNQAVTAQVEVSQNGQYTNYNLIAIRPSTVSSQGLPLAPAISPIPVNTGGGGRSPEVEQRIVRQNVIGTAFNFIAHVYTGAGEEALAEAKGHALALAKELYSHAFHGQAPTPTTAPDVAAQVNEVVGAPAVAVGPPTSTPDW
jgi:hypothetical protein